MEFLIFMVIAATVVYVNDLVSENSSSRNNNRSKKSIETLDIDFTPSKVIKDSPKKNSSQSNGNSKESITNNYNTQNIVNVQVNNYSNTSSKKSPNKDHTEKIWNEMGYEVKYGESYSYKFYGNKIYTPDQVKKNSSYSIKYSRRGLASKLLANTGSKKMAKNILVDQYGVNESEAKRLVGYKYEIEELDI